MERKIKEAIRKCRSLNRDAYQAPLLEQILSVNVDEALYENFRTRPKKVERSQQLQRNAIKKNRERQLREKLPPLYPTVPRKNLSHQECYKNAEKANVTDMSRFLEAQIRNTINDKLALKYPEIVDEIMATVREDFKGVVHETGVKLKVQPYDGTRRENLTPFKFLGKSKKFNVYLRNIKTLNKTLLIHHPLLREILRTRPTLPYLLIDISKIAQDLPTNLDDLRICFVSELKNSKFQLTKYCNKIDHVAQRHADFQTVVKPASGLVSIQLANTVSQTIEHIIEMNCKGKVPKVKLMIEFDGRLNVKPTIDDVMERYVKLIEEMEEHAQNPEVFHANRIVLLNREYISESINKIRKNVEILYEPVLLYLAEVEKDFGGLYKIYNEEEEFNYEKGLEWMVEYKKYIDKANKISSSVYFDIGQLVIEEYIFVLKKTINELIENVFLKVLDLHKAKNLEICQTFESIEQRARETPKSTVELMEMGKYMIWAKTILLKQLEEDIKIMLHQITELVDFGEFTEEHFELNSTAVQWIWKIQPALEANSIMYEQVKADADDKLQRSIAWVNSAVFELKPFLSILSDMDDVEKVRGYLIKITKQMVPMRDIRNEIVWIHQEQTTLNYPKTPFTEFDIIKNFVYPFYHLLKICLDLQRKLLVWLDGQWEFLNANEADQILEDFSKEFIKIQKTYRMRLKQAAAENSEFRFDGIVDDPDMNVWPAPLKLTSRALQKIKEFRPALIMMRIMCNDALLKRHWTEMSQTAGFDLTPNAGTTLRKMTQMGLEGEIDVYDVISSSATKERELLRNLTRMRDEWKDIRFKTSIYKDTGLLILTSLDDIQVILDDQLLKTLTMRGSVFVKPYQSECTELYEKLVRMNDTIDVWGKVQSQWLYLLPIFSSKDIVAQMPEEGVLFKEVNDTFKRYMDAVARDSRVRETAGALGVLETMAHCMELLEQINDGVTSYLEKKRLYFSRFFFLSNDEMLEILSETKNPLRVQPHLKKCFEAINKLDFDSDLQVHGMFSQENEKVAFVDIIKTKDAGGSVEKWLVQVEEQMKKSVRHEIFQSFEDYAVKARNDWVLVWPGQVVLCVSQVYWTNLVHKALNKNEVPSLFETLKAQLNEIVALIRNPKLTNLNRITIKALIVIDVHAKDVVDDLVEKHVQNDKEFKWLSQMRYYWEDECYVRLINATVSYFYEYLGNSDRLVITPLTDRCYRTLIGAFHLHLNGAPEGPAGTGKTETTKDLAKAIAVQCVVFNCSDGLDYKAMGKFFKGLASCGAWVCFDEFNRIDIEVLSVVAQQILSIVLAVRAHATKFLFEGTELNLNPACYVCITMNPGYAGRSELPDNLKVLFRTVAMMVPDYAMIGEISLYSYGFIDARNLSVKIVTTYKLCSEQLSSQNHYDYGMRAVKSVLSAAGNNKRNYPDETEDILLLRAILDVNLPKFLSHDIPLFEGIISDLFPGVVLPKIDYSTFINAVKHCCKKHNLQSTDNFITKIIQTYEMMIVRWGFMIVGEPYAGKTSTLKVLADTLSFLHSQDKGGSRVEYQILNPKAVTMGQLYGQFDPVSYEWTDGVVATCFRRYCTDPSEDRKWMIFDGPVDAVWIENMNSVLDDNRKLCLMSGEVMSMSGPMSLIFEVMDLEQASPATVSRCGMIYMEPVSLGWRPLLQTWIVDANPVWCRDKPFFIDMFEWVVPPCLDLLRKMTQFVNIGQIGLVKNMIQLLEMQLNDAVESMKEDDEKYLMLWTLVAFIQAGLWGLGSALDQDSRSKYDVFYRELWKNLNQDNPYPACLEGLEIPLPGEGMMFDYSYLFKLKGQWRYWPELIKNERLDECANIMQALIPTVDTARYMQLAEMHIKYKKKILLVGPTGTGKSFYLQDLLMNKLNKEIYEPSFITFTVKITCTQTQSLVISKLFKKRRGIYGSSAKGKVCVLFIDDLNMPVKEVYGAQPPLELLRQYFDHGNWYDLKTTEPIYLHDLIFVAAMGLPGGSRQEIYQRFLRHFSIFSINEFSEETMAKIYSNILHLGWKNNGFPSDVITTVNQTVAASLQMYNEAIMNLRPTPSKSHYVFNLRDFSRLIQGCAMLRKESAVDNKNVFVKIWTHEVYRVFYDRLIEEEDKVWVFEKVKVLVRSFFKEHFDTIFESLGQPINTESMRKLMFTTCFDQDAEENERRYEEIERIEAFKDLSNECLDEYNSTHKSKMDIVLFDYALEHLSKICRVVSMSAGSALCVGISGSGRQSLTRLASEIYQQPLFQPEITKNYGLNEWRDDIKKILKEAGGKGRNTIFLITEAQIKEESFLQDVDCLLNSGEVPNIYAIDEKQEILDMVRLAAQGGNRNLDVSALQVFFFFTKRCRERLHIILCFSPIGSSFRTRIRLYPSLVNCCTIDWFEVWPDTALEEVATNWMTDVNLSEDVVRDAITACKYFHVKARQASDELLQTTNRMTYITSASYLELIRSFSMLTNNKQRDLMQAKKRYLGGLEKLRFAAEQIEQMQISLAKLQPKLELMNAQAVQMLKQIEHETIQVENTSAIVREDEKVANAQAASAQELKDECEADLAVALPVLEDALAALDTLKPADINIVKSMKNPPATVKLVMAAVCVIKGVKPNRVPDPATGRMALDFWGPSIKILGDMNFLQNLKDFDKDHIGLDVMKTIRKEYLPHPDFKPEKVAKASSAAEGLCKWIIAMDKYDDVIKIVGPKKEKLEAAEKELSDTLALLRTKKQQLQDLEDKLAILKEKLEEAQRNQQELEAEVDLCKNKLIRAQKLIGGLGGEKNRWTTAANNLQVQYDALAGDILICSAVISYLSPMTASLRQKCMADWFEFVKQLGIPHGKDFDFNAVLGSDVKLQIWFVNGLPRDTFSAANAIIQDNSRKYSLFIDPQQQANNWIKKMEKVNNLSTVKFSHSDYMKKMEYCVQFGFPILIESIGEELDAALDPLLFKKTFKQGGVEVIAIGENVIEFHKNFRLYLTSALRNPHYYPEVFNRVTIINMALTMEGLQDQLLGIVVAVEKPDLQRLKEDLVVGRAENRKALEEVEERILKTLAESKGDILEDENAIQILDDSKILAKNIQEKQEKSLEIEKTIEEFREKYQGVSEHSSVLYYCISDLANVDPMYQYSLDWFINLYISSIQRAEKFKSVEKRCTSLINAFTYDLYTNICRSLFEKHKLLFSFLLCAKILIFQKRLDDHAFMFLLTGGVVVDNKNKNPTTWLPENSWDEICRVDDLSDFKGFRQDFIGNHAKWKEIYDAYEPENESFPGRWNQLSLFSKLIVIRLLRPDKLLVATLNFVKDEMGVKFITPPVFNIAVSFNESYSLCPLIFILSPGVDPMGALVKFAEEKSYTDSFQSISLGQGQGPRAQFLIEQGMEQGLWICLQNCHLATSWMPSLEKIFENLDYHNTHDQFRLWLTSYPSEKFPVSILQKGVKMTNEPPTGLRENLLKSYINDPVKNPDFYDGCPGKGEMFAKLLYGVAFFHAVVQERRTFGPLGWNIAYGFNESDFDISVQQLQMFINESENPYEALSYLIGECNYGGRVTDDWDRRLIVTVLDDFFNPSVVQDPGYKFSSAADYYGLPGKYYYEDFITHIKSLPQTHPPEVFGLNTNAGITRDLQNSNLLLDAVLKAYGEVQAGGAGKTDEYLNVLCGDILTKLPQVFNIEEAKLKYPIEYTESMNTVLVQEMDRFNKLLRAIRGSLDTMLKAIKGLVAMSPQLEIFANSLILSRIPTNWSAVSYPSLKNLPNYIADFIQRINFLQDWFNNGKPACYWVSGFFFTQAFLTGVKQNYARRHTIPIDKLTFDFEITNIDHSDTPADDGAFIYGLFTDGARWDRKKGVIAELFPKILNDVMPLIRLRPIKLDDYHEGTRYKCPVYKTAERKGTLSTTGHSTNYVLPILLKTEQEASHWTKRSVALLCQLN